MLSFPGLLLSVQLLTLAAWTPLAAVPAVTPVKTIVGDIAQGNVSATAAALAGNDDVATLAEVLFQTINGTQYLYTQVDNTTGRAITQAAVPIATQIAAFANALNRFVPIGVNTSMASTSSGSSPLDHAFLLLRAAEASKMDVAGFQQIYSQAVTLGASVPGIIAALGLAQDEPQGVTQALQAATIMWTATSHNLNQSSGTIDDVAQLILNSAHLFKAGSIGGADPEYDRATAQQLAGNVTQSNVSSTVQLYAFAEAIEIGLEPSVVQPEVTMIVIAAAIFADQAEAVAVGYAEAKSRNVPTIVYGSTFCEIRSFAQNMGLGSVVDQALISAYGYAVGQKMTQPSLCISYATT